MSAELIPPTARAAPLLTPPVRYLVSSTGKVAGSTGLGMGTGHDATAGDAA